MTSRILIGGVAAAALIAGTTGAVAIAGPSSAPPSTTSTSAPPSNANPNGRSKTGTGAPGIEADPNLARVAAQLGISANRLLQALPTAKLAAAPDGSLSGVAAAHAVAAALGVSQARAQRALQELFGAGAPCSCSKPASAGPPEPAVAALAAGLHVSTARAGQVLDALDRMANPGHGVDPDSAAFAALAHSLGKTPAELAQILRAWKQSLRATMPRSPSPAPAAPSPTAS